MSQAREKIGPGNRSGIGVGDVNFHLRHNHHGGRQHQRQTIGMGQVIKNTLVHMSRINSQVVPHALGNGQIRQKRPQQHFDHANEHPTRPGQYQPEPPAPAVVKRLGWQKTQVVDLLSYLRHQSKKYRGCGAKQQNIKSGLEASILAIVEIGSTGFSPANGQLINAEAVKLRPVFQL